MNLEHLVKIITRVEAIIAVISFVMVVYILSKKDFHLSINGFISSKLEALLYASAVTIILFFIPMGAEFICSINHKNCSGSQLELILPQIFPIFAIIFYLMIYSEYKRGRDHISFGAF